MDLIWVFPDYPETEETPVHIFSAVKRAVAWFGANVTVLLAGDEIHYTQNMYMDDLRAEVLVYGDMGDLNEFIQKDLFWRGKLAFYDENNFTIR